MKHLSEQNKNRNIMSSNLFIYSVVAGIFVAINTDLIIAYIKDIKKNDTK
jgi:hypothetical protein